MTVSYTHLDVYKRQHYTGKQVVALPIEATAIGNLKIQMSISKGGTV